MFRAYIEDAECYKDFLGKIIAFHEYAKSTEILYKIKRQKK